MTKKRFTPEQTDALYWRYRKQTPPVDDNADLNGPVIVTKPATSLPHPLKCSRCDYIADSAADSRNHWFEEHD